MSTKFTAYDTLTGQVLYGGTADDPEHLADAGLSILLDEVFDSGWIDATKAHHNPPPKPSQHHTFDWDTKQWKDPRTNETQWVEVRAKRAALLSASDWTQLADSPGDKRAWAVYRQALRDITQQADPFNIAWPVAP